MLGNADRTLLLRRDTLLAVQVRSLVRLWPWHDERSRVRESSWQPRGHVEEPMLNWEHGYVARSLQSRRDIDTANAIVMVLRRCSPEAASGNSCAEWPALWSIWPATAVNAVLIVPVRRVRPPSRSRAKRSDVRGHYASMGDHRVGVPRKGSLAAQLETPGRWWWA